MIDGSFNTSSFASISSVLNGRSFMAWSGIAVWRLFHSSEAIASNPGMRPLARILIRAKN